MESDPDRTRLNRHLDAWGSRLHSWGLDGVAAALLDAAEPLSPLGAQLLYVAQPALRVLLPSAQIGEWAALLEDPANVAWMRDRLIGDQVADPARDEEDTPDGPDA